MPINSQINNEKVEKTKKIFIVANLALLPLFLFDPFVGLCCALTLNLLMISKLHELGKQRRPGSNAINQIQGFFATPTQSARLDNENSLKNIINGGAHLYDLVAQSLLKLL